MRLKFGITDIECTLPDKNVLGIIEPRRPSIRPYDELLKQSLLDPIGKPRLKTMLRKNRPGDVVIIVSDKTRQIAHYREVLDLLIGEIVDSGVDERAIECIIALGTHRRHTEEENQRVYGDLLEKVKFSFHDCHKDLVRIGAVSTGLEVFVNKRAHDADFVIATGKIDFHYMAGFSGGRKAVLPGIAGYDTVRANHCKLKRDGVALGSVQGNIIAQEMHEAALLFGLDYLMNVVETPDHETCGILCGDSVQAFEHGVSVFREHRVIPVSGPADCAIVSSGGDPGDRYFYGGHKALDNVVPVVKSGGRIILVAQCGKGMGNEEFHSLLSEHTVDDLLCASEEGITIGGHRAYHTARLLHGYTIIVISDLDQKEILNIHFKAAPDLAAAIEQVKNHSGDNFTCYVVPNGHTVLPVIHSTS